MRIWSLPGYPRIEQETSHDTHLSFNTFWYCRHCSSRYAELRYCDGLPGRQWSAKAGVCGSCKPDWSQLPGSLGWWTANLGWPEEVLAYEFSCELRFLDSPYYPARTKEEAS